MSAEEEDKRPVVLLIDDQPIVAASVRYRLDGGGFNFQYCQDSAQAIPTAIEVRPTVILLDLNMPNVDGMTVLRFLRAHPVLADVPIIIMSTTEDAETKAQAFELGANDYVIKLPDPVELLARVSYNSRAYLDHIGRAEANRKLEELNTVLEKRANRAEELFERFMDHSPALACIKDDEGRYVYLNRRLGDLVGGERETLVGKTDFDLWPQSVAELTTENDRGFKPNKEAAPALEVLTEDSHWMTYRFGLETPEGEPMLGVVGVDVTEQVRAQGELRRVAYHDALTGLPNRAFLVDHLEESVAQDKKFALLFADLDGFKLVNDSMGHQAGDELLVEIATRMTANTPEGGTVARLGGDEFTLMVDSEMAMSVAQSLHQSLAKPIVIREKTVFVGVSLGVAFREDESADELLRNADIAMYRAKDEGKGCTRVYEEGMHLEVVSRLELELELRQGVEAEQFVNHYQPIVCLETGKLVGFEVLLRWNHPERGLLCPGDFLQSCEESGLISAIGSRVLREACSAASKWKGPFVSVNLSRRQLEEPGFEDDLLDLVDNSGIDPNWLKLEIDDSVLTAHAKRTTQALSRIAELPIQLSLNDFASGQSSLNVLNSVAFDTVKLDHSIVSQLQEREQTQTIARSAIELAKELGIITVAAGIEDEAQLTLLRDMGCRYGQGYLFSEGVPRKKAGKLLKTWDSSRWAFATL